MNIKPRSFLPEGGRATGGGADDRLLALAASIPRALAMSAATVLTVAACTSFSTDETADSSLLDAAVERAAPTPPDPDGGSAAADAGRSDASPPSADAGCPALPAAATSLVCAGALCAAPGSLCCSPPSGVSMICTPGGAGCGVSATHRTRRCGSRLHCQGGQQHCCASAFRITAAGQCPLLAEGEDAEGWGSSCEVAACAPSIEICAAGDVCPSGTKCVPVSIVTDGAAFIMGICVSP